MVINIGAVGLIKSRRGFMVNKYRRGPVVIICRRGLMVKDGRTRRGGSRR